MSVLHRICAALAQTAARHLAHRFPQLRAQRGERLLEHRRAEHGGDHDSSSAFDASFTAGTHRSRGARARPRCATCCWSPTTRARRSRCSRSVRSRMSAGVALVLGATAQHAPRRSGASNSSSRAAAETSARTGARSDCAAAIPRCAHCRCSSSSPRAARGDRDAARPPARCYVTYRVDSMRRERPRSGDTRAAGRRHVPARRAS